MKTSSAIELKLEFEGRGYDHVGWHFKQIAATEFGYVYEKTDDSVDCAYYEVFKRVVSKEIDVSYGGNAVHYPEQVKYPGNTAFGEWAWCCSTLARALEILKSFELRQL